MHNIWGATSAIIRNADIWLDDFEVWKVWERVDEVIFNSLLMHYGVSRNSSLNKTIYNTFSSPPVFFMRISVIFVLIPRRSPDVKDIFCKYRKRICSHLSPNLHNFQMVGKCCVEFRERWNGSFLIYAGNICQCTLSNRQLIFCFKSAIVFINIFRYLNCSFSWIQCFVPHIVKQNNNSRRHMFANI